MNHFLIFFLLILVFVISLIGCSDSIDDSDLIVNPSPMIVGDKENAYYSFAQANEAAAGSIEDFETVEEYLLANAEAFRLLEEGLACPYCQAPAPTRVGCPAVEVRDWFGVADDWLDRAEYLLETGNEAEAFNWALKVAQVGHRMQGCHGTLMYFLVAVPIKEYAVDWIIKNIPDINLTPEALKYYADEVGKLTTDREWMAFCFQLEYTQLANAVDDIWSDTADNRNVLFFFVYNPNDTKEWFVKIFRPVVKELLSEPYEMNYEVPEYWDVGIGLFDAKKFTVSSFIGSSSGLNNIVGIEFYQVAAPGIVKFVGTGDDDVIIETQMLLAFKCYEKKYGTLPQTLDELVPDCLSSLPKTSSSGHEVKYLPEEKRFWVETIHRDYDLEELFAN